MVSGWFALGQSLPQSLVTFQVNGELNSTNSSSTFLSRDEAYASSLISTLGNIVVPSFISTYSTVGNPGVSSVAQSPILAIYTP